MDFKLDESKGGTQELNNLYITEKGILFYTPSKHTS